MHPQIGKGVHTQNTGRKHRKEDRAGAIGVPKKAAVEKDEKQKAGRLVSNGSPRPGEPNGFGWKRTAMDWLDDQEVQDIDCYPEG